jgi:hypothetical protein
MDQACFYEIRIEGQLTERWSDWFGGLTLEVEANGETTLRGPLPDQAALLGVLTQLHALNLTLISVRRTGLGGSASALWSVRSQTR